MKNISVVIITKNEEDLIEECLKSTSWADEIILVDAESSDKTIEIAQKYTDKIFLNKWKGFSDQKSFAMDLANNEWVFSLDADERVSEELKREIEKLTPADENGFSIPRENYFLKKKITSCGWEKDSQVRLFRKSKTKLTERLVHEGFEVNGKVGQLKNTIIHYTFNSIEKTILKINNYSTLQALEKWRDKKNIKSFTIVLHGVSAFFRSFLSLRGYKDGIYGLMISIIHSMTTFLTYMKIWELQNKND